MLEKIEFSIEGTYIKIYKFIYKTIFFNKIYTKGWIEYYMGMGY